MRLGTFIRVISGFTLKRSSIAAFALTIPIAFGWAQGNVSGRVTLLEKPGQKTTDLENAVVWIEAPGGASVRPRATKLELRMEARQFAPHVRVVTVGSTVDFPNKDPFPHNIFSSTPGTAFDLGLYSRGQSKDQLFAKVGVVPVYCNVHAKMASFVVVVPTTLFAQAQADGRWSIAGVPAGKYMLHVWHERGTEQTLPLTVAANGSETPDVQLDARGYVLAEHKDKFGKDYTGPGQIKY
jgi:plastocyanin